MLNPQLPSFDPRHLRVVLFTMLFVLTFVILLRMVEDYMGINIPNGDENWFLPVVWQYATMGLLYHPLASPIGDGLGGAFLWHGWLMPVVQGAIQPFESYRHIQFAGHVIALCLFFGYVLLLYVRFSLLAAVVAAPSLCALFVYQTGRPELIISAILLFFLYLYNHAPALPLNTVTLALAGVTSPAASVLLAAFVGLDHLRKRPPFYRVARLGATYFLFVPFLIVLLTWSFTELSPFDWIRGVIEHARHINARGDGSFIQYFVLNTSFPLAALFFLFLPLFLCRSGQDKNPHLAAFAAFIILILIIFYLSVRLPPAVYNFCLLIPLIIYLGLDYKGSTRTSNAFLFILSIHSVASCVILGREASMSVANIVKGNDPSYFSEQLDALPISVRLDAQLDKDFSAVPFLLEAGVDRARLKLGRPVEQHQTGDVLAGFQTASDARAVVRIEVQAHSGRLMPPLNEQECLIVSNFHDTHPKILGIPIGHTFKDWSFAFVGELSCKDRLRAEVGS